MKPWAMILATRLHYEDDCEQDTKLIKHVVVLDLFVRIVVHGKRQRATKYCEQNETIEPSN